MILQSLAASDIDLVWSWLQLEENHKWLDFGAGLQVLPKPTLALMNHHETHLLRLYFRDEESDPLGLVALSNVSSSFRSATLWYVLGDKSQGARGFTTRAAGEMLALGFLELALKTINAWAVAANRPSIRVLEKNGFRMIGRQRNCHLVDGKLEDRVLFDLLATEHRSRILDAGVS